MMSEMRVYLDNCCFNRPFDDQSQIRIRLEAEAKLFVQDRVREGQLQLVWSYILDYENSANPFEERRVAIGEWKSKAAVDVGETPEILATADILFSKGLKAKDALHVACAIHAGCEYFLRTDDTVLKKGQDIRDVKIVDPPTFVREVRLITDTEIKVRGLKALADALGHVGAERFITLLMREPFDYTEWQKSLWPERSVEDISKAAMEFRIKNGERS
jgi:predicted nucleic acid-binding protein